jgi:Flp pilus assembly protein TadG
MTKRADARIRQVCPSIGWPAERLASHLRASRIASEDGSALVEMAVSCIVLIMLTFGLMETCLALYSYHFVSEAAREATRYAIVRGSACTGFASACPAAAADIQSYIQNLGFPGIDASNLTATTTWSAYPAGTSCNPSASCNNPGNLVQVTVQYQFPLSIPFVPQTTLNMSSTSSMVISN